MLAYLFVIIAIAVRFLPHPMQFTPVGAALLFFGAKMPRKQAWIPVVLLAASDVVLTKFVYGYPFSGDHYVTWAWYLGAIAIGTLLRKNDGLVRVAGASLASSVSFFLVSNLAVFFAWTMYPKTWNGLALCYTAALPFFRNTLISDMIFAIAFFSVPVAIEVLTGRPARERA